MNKSFLIIFLYLVLTHPSFSMESQNITISPKNVKSEYFLNAIQKGNLTEVEEQLKDKNNRPDLIQVTSEGFNPLHVAVGLKQTKIAEVILKYCPELAYSNTPKDYPSFDTREFLYGKWIAISIGTFNKRSLEISMTGSIAASEWGPENCSLLESILKNLLVPPKQDDVRAVVEFLLLQPLPYDFISLILEYVDVTPELLKVISTAKNYVVLRFPRSKKIMKSINSGYFKIFSDEYEFDVEVPKGSIRKKLICIEMVAKASTEENFSKKVYDDFVEIINGIKCIDINCYTECIDRFKMSAPFRCTFGDNTIEDDIKISVTALGIFTNCHIVQMHNNTNPENVIIVKPHNYLCFDNKEKIEKLLSAIAKGVRIQEGYIKFKFNEIEKVFIEKKFYDKLNDLKEKLKCLSLKAVEFVPSKTRYFYNVHFDDDQGTSADLTTIRITIQR